MIFDELVVLCRKLGAVGFDYDQNAAGAIDWFRLHYAFEEPVCSVRVEPLPEPVPEATVKRKAEVKPVAVSLPELQPVAFASIPQPMRDVPRWCVWQKKLDGRKIPYRVLEKGVWSRAEPCKSNEASHWVSFDEALHCFLKANGHLGGLSFALGDGWCGFDFDDVIVKGEIHPKVQSWLSRLGGYQEKSQSGNGIKVVLRGTLLDAFLGSAKTGRQFKNIPVKEMATEVYHCRRFFFLTGEGRGDPRANQATIDAICVELEALKPKPKPKLKSAEYSPAPLGMQMTDDAVLRKIRGSRQSAKFERLWRGHVSDYASESEADMALTSILMFWCQNDKAQVERLFEQSALAQREKWSREDYRERTLVKGESAEVYTPRVAKNYQETVAKIRRAMTDGK